MNLPKKPDNLEWWVISIMALFLLFVLSACGKNAVPPPVDPSPTPNPVEATVYVFGAPPCTYCSTELQQLQTALKNYPNVKVTVYTTFGRTFMDRPTPEVTSSWKRLLNSDFTFIEDAWKCRYYKTFFGNSCAIPASVVLKNDVVAKLLPAGTSYAVDEIIATLKGM